MPQLGTATSRPCAMFPTLEHLSISDGAMNSTVKRPLAGYDCGMVSVIDCVSKLLSFMCCACHSLSLLARHSCFLFLSLYCMQLHPMGTPVLFELPTGSFAKVRESLHSGDLRGSSSSTLGLQPPGRPCHLAEQKASCCLHSVLSVTRIAVELSIPQSYCSLYSLLLS